MTKEYLFNEEQLATLLESTRRAALAAAPVQANGYELTRSIIHECPALKLPQSFTQRLGMTAQILPLKGFTQEQAEALLADLNAAPVQELPHPLPETMSKDEMLRYYSNYANLCAHEALQYQKRIRELEARIRQMLEDKPSVQEPSTPENEQRLMQLLSEALGARHPAIDDLARLIFDARKGRTHPPAQAPQQRLSALVNELVEQGQFYQRGEIDEPTFIRVVNHYVSQLAAPQQGRVPLSIKQINALPEAKGAWPMSLNERIIRLIRAVERAHGIVSQGAQDQEGK